MDVKQLKEANEAIAMLKELDLPISIEQLGKRKMLKRALTEPRTVSMN